MKNIYLDNAATTRVYPAVVKEMEKFMLFEYGNASSLHELGENALEAITGVRRKIARELNAKPEEIYFTSGGTESDNLALMGVAKANKNVKKNKIIISSIEHPAVYETAIQLERLGYHLIKIPVDVNGLIDINRLEREVDNSTLIVSVMHVNNIFGVIQDVEKIGQVCKRNGCLFHTDAVQSFGKVEIDVKRMDIDLLSASAHKIGGPKGIGILYVREGVSIEPIVYGGGQEKGLRSGTENVAGIIGLGKALEIIRKVDKKKITKIRDKLIDELEKIGGVVNGSRLNRVYNNVHVSFSGIDARTLVSFLSEKGIFVSAGSACDSKKEKEDYVLKAIGLGKKDMDGSIRITLNEDLKEKDIRSVVNEIDKAVKKLKI